MSLDTGSYVNAGENNLPPVVHQTPQVSSLDIMVVAGYFVLVALIAFYSMFNSNRSTVSGYFLAGRYMLWLPVGASVFASNIGAEHFIGLAGSGVTIGMGVGAFELNALLILQLTGWIFLPVFIASKVCTLPEFMSKRFGRNRIRTYLAVLSLILYIFTKISVNLYCGAIFIEQALGWSLNISVSMILFMTSLCTITGGLSAVIYTDTLQALVMIIGSTVVAISAFIKVGGYEALEQKYMHSIPSIVPENKTICAQPNEKAFQILRSANDPDIPWPGFLLGQTPASIWYWCADQLIVQRLLSAKNLSHAQGATLFAGYLKILPLFLIVIPGMISRVLFTDSVACVDPAECQKYCQRDTCSNIAYPKLVLELMPSGFRGLMIAVMLAALMSDLTSIFNSASTLFTMDIWPRLRKNITVREMMVVGRLYVVFMVVVSIIWIPVIENMQEGQLYVYIQTVAAYLSPPIAAVYLMAILWKRMNEAGAFWALMVTFVIGIIRMGLDIYYKQAQCGEEDLRPDFLKLQYMNFAMLLFWFTVIISAIISVCTEPPEEYMLIRTTFWSRHDDHDREDEIEMKASEMRELSRINNDEDEVKITTRVSMLKYSLTWFCGMEDVTHNNRDNERVNVDHLSSLSQSPKHKLILRSSLCLLISIAIFLFTYFSVPLKYR